MLLKVVISNQFKCDTIVMGTTVNKTTSTTYPLCYSFGIAGIDVILLKTWKSRLKIKKTKFFYGKQLKLELRGCH